MPNVLHVPENPDTENPGSWEGGHALVVEYGDCELYGQCSCGQSFGMIRPNQSIDKVFAAKWERHVMTLPPHPRKS